MRREPKCGRQTDERTDGQTDMVIPVYPPNFVAEGIIKTSARVGYAPPVLKRTPVKVLKVSRLSIRGDEDQGLVSSEGIWTSPVI